MSNITHACTESWDMATVDYPQPVEALIPGVPGRVLGVLARTESQLTMRTVARLARVGVNRAAVVRNALVSLGVVERRAAGSALLVQLGRADEASRLSSLCPACGTCSWPGCDTKLPRSPLRPSASSCSAHSSTERLERAATWTSSRFAPSPFRKGNQPRWTVLEN